jgi:hypothetical protein
MALASQCQVEFLLVDDPLPQLAVKGGDSLGLPVQAAGNIICGCQRPYFLPARVARVQAHKAGGVEILHQARSARSAAMPAVLSVPLAVLPP